MAAAAHIIAALVGVRSSQTGFTATNSTDLHHPRSRAGLAAPTQHTSGYPGVITWVSAPSCECADTHLSRGAIMSTQIHPRTTTVDGLSVRFAEGGTGPRHAMLLSPWPESIFAYEQVWPRLPQAARVVAVDSPGSVDHNGVRRC